MAYYDRIYISDSIDVSKANSYKECIKCHYWYFSDKEFKCKLSVRNDLHGILMMPFGLLF